MSKISVQIPNALHQQLRECARAEGTSVEQLIHSAVGEKLAALLSQDYLRTRAKRGSRKKFEAALKSVPDIDPPEYDRLPNQALQRTAATQRKRRRPPQKGGGR
jgi:hypothetical protein